LNNTSPKNKDIMDIPNQKILVNHVRKATLVPVVSKETYKSMNHIKDTPKVKEDEQIHEKTSSKPELILNSDIYEKSKLSDNNCKILNPKTRWQTDNINNTTVFPVK